MDIFLAIVLFLVASVLVAKGADFFVSASSWMSDVTGVSKVLIGSTVVAIATSGPELFVSLIAAMQGNVDMSIGNVVGSHLCNLGIAFALIAICRPNKNEDRLFLPNGLIMLAVTALLLIFSYFGDLNIIQGAIYLLIFALFTFINIKFDSSNQMSSELLLKPVTEQGVSVSTDETNANISNMNSADSAQTEGVMVLGSIDSTGTQKPKRVRKPTNKKEITINIIKFALGLAGIIYGSKLIVDNATFLALKMGVSQIFIGLTLVAVGTSLPEIVTTIVAIIKKESDLGIGNIIGSNIFNNTFILALATFFTGGLAFNESIKIDLSVAMALMLVTIVPTAISKKIYRWQGILLVTMYVLYVAYLIINS